MNIRQATARTVTIGPILDADGVAKTDEVVASILASKNGGVAAALDSVTLTHSQTGYYRLALTAVDTDTLGTLELSLNSGTNTMPIKEMNVATAEAWDALYAESGGALPAKATSIRTAVGMDAANLDTQLAAILSNAGTGARTLTITVNDGTDPLESAKVRFTKGAESYVQTTNASGICTFGLDEGTWTVTITLIGYSFTPTTKVVSATGSQTYSMSAISITASDPELTTGYLFAYDEDGNIEQGVEFGLQMTGVADSEGYAYDGAIRTATSDSDGLVEFTNLFKGGTYSIRRGTRGKSYSFTIPANEESTFPISSVIGRA